MQVDYNGLRNNIFDDYKALQKLFQEAKKDGGLDSSEILVDGHQLEKIMAELRNDLVFLAGVYSPEAGIENLINDEFELPPYRFEFECDECGNKITELEFKENRLCKTCAALDIADDCPI